MSVTGYWITGLL